MHITRVQQFIRTKRLPAEKVGRDRLIDENDLALVSERKTGRPPVSSEKKASKKWTPTK